MHALVAHRWLVTFPAHPATSDRFRKAFVPSGAKDDVPDAIMLLRVLIQHREQPHPLKLNSAETRKVAALVAARRRAVAERPPAFPRARQHAQNLLSAGFGAVRPRAGL